MTAPHNPDPRPFIEEGGQIVSPSFRGIAIGRVISTGDSVVFHLGSNTLTLADPFEATDAGGTFVIRSSDETSMHRLRTFEGLGIAQLTVTADHALALTYAGGLAIRAKPQPDRPSWEIWVRAKHQLRCLAGGELEGQS